MREITSIFIAPPGPVPDFTEAQAEILGLKSAPKVLELEQGSLEWSLERAKYITASEVAGVAGEAKWSPKTMQQVLLRKRGVTPNFDNVAMAHGRVVEPIARAQIEAEFLRSFPPVVMTRGGLLASLDGWDPETQTLVEIKCPYSISQLAEDVPGHYVAQLATQAWVSQARTVLFCQYHGGMLLVISVDAEELRKDFVEKYAHPVCEAYGHLVAGTYPEQERTDEDWEIAASQFAEATKIAKEAEKAAEFYRDRLIKLSGESDAVGGGVSVSWVTREGSVNWKAKEIVEALKAASVDPNEYRGKATRYAKVTVVEPK